MLWVREQPLFAGVELSQPCKQWSSGAVIAVPIYTQHGVQRSESKHGSTSPKECVGSTAGTANIPQGAGVHL